MAERFLAATFNRPGHPIIDHYTYALCSDGDLMEGVASEAASLAGTLGLGRIIYVYDDNEISIEGDTDLSFREDVGARFAAYGWHVQHVADGNDVAALTAAIEGAKAVTDRPSLIVARTVIAYGSPNKAGSEEAHGSPLGEEEVRLTKKALDWPLEPDFFVPDDVLAEWRTALERCTHVVHLAGRAHVLGRQRGESAARFEAVNTAGTLRLADQAGAEHQLVADDLGVGGRFLGNGQKMARKTHLGSNLNRTGSACSRMPGRAGQQRRTPTRPPIPLLLKKHGGRLSAGDSAKPRDKAPSISYPLAHET